MSLDPAKIIDLIADPAARADFRVITENIRAVAASGDALPAVERLISGRPGVPPIAASVPTVTKRPSWLSIGNVVLSSALAAFVAYAHRGDPPPAGAPAVASTPAHPTTTPPPLATSTPYAPATPLGRSVDAFRSDLPAVLRSLKGKPRPDAARAFAAFLAKMQEDVAAAFDGPIAADDQFEDAAKAARP